VKSAIPGKTAVLMGVLLTGACFTLGQEPPTTLPPASAASSTAAPEYKPKFRGDPAHSNAEAGALGYLRTVLMAQKLYKRKHEAFATSLPGLVHTGSFTQRMTKTDRGDYSVIFHAEAKGTGFSLSLAPKQYDAGHRAFFADDTGVIRAEDNKEATENSPKLK
jgi:hypothetical protein